jgi:glycopeptide antibiotics resistance protein
VLGADDFLIVAIPAALVGLAACHAMGAKGAGFGRYVGLAMLSVYGASLIALTLFPIPVSTGYREFLSGIDATPRHNITPFETLRATASAGRSVFLYQVGGNAIVLAPLPIFVASLWPQRGDLRSILAIGLGVTTSIELAQLSISEYLGVEYKSFDIDDVVLNMLGVLIGWTVWQALDRCLRHRPWWVEVKAWFLAGRARQPDDIGS